MKTQKEIKALLENHLKNNPVVYFYGLDYMRKYKRPDFKIAQAINKDGISLTKIAKAVRENAKKDEKGEWWYIAFGILNDYCKDSSSEIFKIIVEALENAVKVDKSGKWCGVVLKIYSHKFHTDEQNNIIQIIINCIKQADKVATKNVRNKWPKFTRIFLTVFDNNPLVQKNKDELTKIAGKELEL